MPRLNDGQSRSDHRAKVEAERRLAEREAFEERAAIIEEGAKVNRATSERWARRCLDTRPGAVRFVHLLASSGAVRRAP